MDEVLREIAMMEGRLVEEKEEEVKVAGEEESTDGHVQEQEGEGEGEGQEAAARGEEGEVEETLEAKYSRLLEFVNQQSAQLNAIREAGYTVGEGLTPPAPTPAAAVIPPASPTGPASPPVSWTLDEKLLEKALIEDDPAAMKEVLLGMFQAMQQSSSGLRERILVDLPTVVQSEARRQYTIQKAVEKFYTDNEDLVPHAHVVSMIATQVASKEPSLGMQEVFEKAEKEARTVLGLKQRARQLDAEGGRGKPAFAKVKASRKPGAPEIKGVRGEIARMQAAKW